MLKEKKVFVIGHKNPDTDSICSAIAYAALKNKTDDGVFVPKERARLTTKQSTCWIFSMWKRLNSSVMSVHR